MFLGFMEDFYHSSEGLWSGPVYGGGALTGNLEQDQLLQGASCCWRPELPGAGSHGASAWSFRQQTGTERSNWEHWEEALKELVPVPARVRLAPSSPPSLPPLLHHHALLLMLIYSFISCL